MNRVVDTYLAELEARRFSHSRRHHVARTLERLLLYLREAHHVTDWRVVNETHLRDFAVYAATRHRTPKGKAISATTLRQWLSIIRSFFIWMNATVASCTTLLNAWPSQQRATIATRAQRIRYRTTDRNSGHRDRTRHP